jgi:beta-glucosidase
MTRTPTVFPADFTWGAATSSYQIEGAWNEDGKGESIWDRFAHTQGRIVDGTTGDVACDHYHRWRDDIELMASLGLGAYRFSINWPRILPTGRGPINLAGLDFYSNLVDGLLAAGIEPFPTLYHWELPQALEDVGGWLNRGTIDAFEEYTAVVVDRLGDRVSHWSTINEPWVAANLGYGMGLHAPGRTGAELEASHHLMVAHGRATRVIRADLPDSEIGVVLNLWPQTPASDHDDDILATRLGDGVANRWYLDPLTGRGYPEDARHYLGTDLGFVLPGDLEDISTPLDFLGVNYYSRNTIVSERDADTGRLGWKVEYPGSKTAMGWAIDPEGLTEILERVHRDYGFADYRVTECGAAFDDIVGESGEVDDVDRTEFLVGHVAAAHRAVAAGVPLSGFFVWSLLDNFEWGMGLGKRFGIIHVDFETLERRPKASARWYARVIAHNGLANEPGGSDL